MTEKTLIELLNAIPVPALAINVDMADRIIAANTGAQTLIGQPLVDRNYVTMLRQPGLLDIVESTWQDGKPRNAKYVSNDGVQDTTFDVSARFADGIFEGTSAVILCFFDITHVEEADQMRRDFIANVSHELRTPLTSLLGFIETLKGPAREDPDALERFLDIMHDEGERMSRLVGDLMSLNRVESDERVRPTTQVELIGILDTVCRSLSALATEAGVTLEKDFDVDRVEMAGDADQLQQVFSNLVENAIKYGGGGGRVTIRARLSERETALRAPGVRVQVIDYGAGIDPLHLPRITERFYRADDHRSRAMGGTGLGLAIVKHIINRHRGRLRVVSDLGKGATFSVILPIGRTLRR